MLPFTRTGECAELGGRVMLRVSRPRPSGGSLGEVTARLTGVQLTMRDAYVGETAARAGGG
ncbi:DUF6004 family protein [Streptomyces camelliae]|uniref:DUF6004 family protein n=1 Tax=Streptomyces camelliae TaxID=3004093 RepID=UPI002FD84DBD